MNATDEQIKAAKEEKLARAEMERRRVARRHRLGTRLGMIAVLASAVFLGGIMYFEISALGPDRAALVLRFGQLQRVVTDQGHVYRIPLLDRIMLVDLRPQPLPNLRQSAMSADGQSATVEIQGNWVVFDAEAFWRVAMARPENGSKLIEIELAPTIAAAARKLPAALLQSAEGRRALADDIVATVTPSLEKAGIRLQDLRVKSVQIIR